MNWLLDIYDVGVVGDTVSGSTTPSNIVPAAQLDSFTLGVLVGLASAIGIWILVKICIKIFIKVFYKNDDEESE